MGRQPSQESETSRVVSGRLTPAQFLSLDQELSDRGMKRSVLVADLVLAWLGAVTGRGYRCTCPDCPGNMTGRVRRARQRKELVDSLAS